MADPVIVPRAEHPISSKDIDPDAVKVLYRLRDFNYTGYLVGGGVRDLLLGRKPKDFDVGTDAHPYQIKKLFRNCWIIGRRFRLAHVRFGTKTIEVATFRRHVAADEVSMQPRTRPDPDRRAGGAGCIAGATGQPAGRRRNGARTTTPSARPKRMPSGATSPSTRCSTTSGRSRSSITSAAWRTCAAG